MPDGKGLFAVPCPSCRSVCRCRPCRRIISQSRCCCSSDVNACMLPHQLPCLSRLAAAPVDLKLLERGSKEVFPLAVQEQQASACCRLKVTPEDLAHAMPAMLPKKGTPAAEALEQAEEASSTVVLPAEQLQRLRLAQTTNAERFRRQKSRVRPVSPGLRSKASLVHVRAMLRGAFLRAQHIEHCRSSCAQISSLAKRICEVRVSAEWHRGRILGSVAGSSCRQSRAA